jgi:tRNA A-37 threonylcarbamoyl transferase component Bud32
LSQDEQEDLFFKLATALADVHEAEYAVGDFTNLENVLIDDDDERIVFIDCNPGKPDDPNSDFHCDCQEELIKAANHIFGRSKTKKASELINSIEKTKQFTSKTLRELLRDTPVSIEA